MPVPTHTFDPPFNIIRCSHAVLDVTDLDKSRAFYETTVGLHVEDADDKAVYLRGSEEHQHHSLVLRKAPVAACSRLGFKVGNDGDLDKAASFFSENGITYAFAEQPFQGRTLQFTDPAGFQLELYADDGEAPASAAALRPLQRLPSAAARSFQRLRARSPEHRRLLRPARLPPHRIWRGRRPERAHRGGLDAPQGQCPRLRHHQWPWPSPASFRLLGADGDECPAPVRRDGVQRLSRRTSSAAPDATAFRTRSSSTSAIPTATASSSTPATTSPATTTTSRCAGR